MTSGATGKSSGPSETTGPANLSPIASLAAGLSVMSIMYIEVRIPSSGSLSRIEQDIVVLAYIFSSTFGACLPSVLGEYGGGPPNVFGCEHSSSCMIVSVIGFW